MKNCKSLVLASILPMIYQQTTLASSSDPLFAGGDGTSGSPYQITTCQQLQNMREVDANYFILVSHIDCSDSKNWNDGRGFEPIAYGRNIDGQNYTIANLYIKSKYDTNEPLTQWIGMFRETNETVKNITFKNSQVIAEGINAYVGLIAGQARLGDTTYAENIVASGSVSATSGFAGGLFGQVILRAPVQLLKNVHSSIHVSGVYYIGGLVAYLQTDTNCAANSCAPIQESASVGKVNIVSVDDSLVTSIGSSFAGGLVGYLYNGAAGKIDIADSYSSADISVNIGSKAAAYYTGGMIGGSSRYSGIINSFVTSKFQSNKLSQVNRGGFVGYRRSTSYGQYIYNSYWNTDTTITTVNYGGSGQVTNALTTPTNNTGIYAKWNPSVWDFGTSRAYPRPKKTTGVLIPPSPPGTPIKPEYKLVALDPNKRNAEAFLSADYTNNGLNELIVDFGNEGLWAYTQGFWSRLLNKNVEQFSVADWTGDGDKNLIFDVGIEGLFYHDKNDLDTPTKYILENNSESFEIIDIDGNGKNDLIADFGELGVWKFSFETGMQNYMYNNPEKITIVDYNGDDILDLLMDLGETGFAIYDQTKNSANLLFSNNMDDFHVVDFNGDGINDLVFDIGDLNVVIHDQATKTNSRIITPIDALTNPKQIVVGRHFGNALPDIVFDYGDQKGIVTYETTFRSWDVLTESEPTLMKMVDFDSDGSKELFYTTQNGDLVVVNSLNTEESFTIKDESIEDFEVTDFNGDQLMDIILDTKNNGVKVYASNGLLPGGAVILGLKYQANTIQTPNHYLKEIVLPEASLLKKPESSLPVAELLTDDIKRLDTSIPVRK